MGGIKHGLRSAMRWLQTFSKAPEVIHAVVKGAHICLKLCLGNEQRMKDFGNFLVLYLQQF